MHCYRAGFPEKISKLAIWNFTKLIEISVLPIMTASLILTPVMCVIRNSWLVLWVALEVNTLSFCTLIRNQTKKYIKRAKESAIKYFIIQSVASAVLVIYLSTQKNLGSTEILFFGGTIAVLIKLAASPFHRWFVEVIKKTTLKNRIILITWQKLAPIYLLMFMMKPLIVLSMLLSTLIGRALQLTTKTILEIMALSSIFNLGWIIMALLSRTKTLLIFTGLYWISIMLVIAPLTKIKIRNIEKDVSSKFNPWSIIVIMATLAGLPPTIGFLAKWATVTQALKTKALILVRVILILRTVNFYIYLRTTLTIIISNQSNKQKRTKKATPGIMLATMIMNLPILMFIAI